MEAFYEFKMGCPKGLALPIPQRGNTSGYSWTAWCQAAQTAGARRRPFSLKECIQAVDSCVEHWHSQIIEWRDHPEISTTHIREFCQPILDACLLSEDLPVITHPHTMILNRRVRDVFEGYCYWFRIKRSFDTLVHLGLEEGGRKATLQVLTPGPIHDEYAKLQRIVSHVEKMSEKAVQIDFAMGRGRIYVEPYNASPSSLSSIHALNMTALTDNL
ncbi:hypothetical protein I302_107277 [Kwoniella bestiolae CBS 10118]|uniref:Uncharacterized protein n=1 Tax=Kwoniella bestiolae CBS 10118 TaxID=1296100 RepID=A0A1B9FZ20_9TREE|nr:hypothetical protein I302_06987 [Kwoniella bestiolae CBS 10118]OCF24001.1 hypothetical protein I302_06987 [Kwoniella bestiolae CBS 10118]